VTFEVVNSAAELAFLKK